MAFGTTVKISYLVVAIAFIITIYYRPPSNDDPKLVLIKNALLDLEYLNVVDVGKFQPKVIIGFGACHDIFVNATEFLNYNLIESVPKHIDDISSEQDLVTSFAYYFKHGAATEQYISNEEVFNALVKRAEKLLNVTWSLGGNAPLMAKRFHHEGWSVMLGARMTDALKKYIPEQITIVRNSEILDRDDIHMILEYRAGENWGPYTSPRANRYILHNDKYNPMIMSLEDLIFEDIILFNSDLFIVSGLQMMDNIPFKSGVREARLELLKSQLSELKSESLIHFEMASYVEESFLNQILIKIIPHVHSLGMNEQELNNLYSMIKYKNVSFIADSNPRVAIALDQMRLVFANIRVEGKKLGESHLSRIHVHTLAYQAILTVKKSNWKRTQAAAAKASLTAFRYVCKMEDININKAKLVMDDSFSTSTTENSPRINLDPETPVSCWDELLSGVIVEICVAPVLVCTEAQLTAGAGDNISAAGLVLQVISSDYKFK